MKKLLLILLCLPMIGFGQGIYGCTDSIATNYNPNAIQNGFSISNVLTYFGEVINEIPFGALLLPNGSTNSTPDIVNAHNEDTSSYTNSSIYAINDTISNGSLILEFFNGYPFDMSNISISIFECSSASSCYAIGNYTTPLIISGTTFVDSISLNGYNLNNSLLVIIDNIDWNSSNGPVFINYVDAMIIKLSMSDVDICTYIYGCTDSLACNYNFSANIDDGLCILPDGCTDPTALNYDIAATCNDGSCTYALNCSVTGTNLCCYQDNSGTIDLTVLGGTPLYTYNWTGPAGYTSFVEDPQNLAAGTYNVTVTDNNGTSTNCNITLTEPDLFTSSITGTNLDCYQNNSGTIDLTVFGGIPLYTYNWIGPAGYTSSVEDPQNLAAGTYNVTVADWCGCTILESITIIEPVILFSYDTLSVNASIVWNGIPLNVSGDYSVTLINSVGCDSIVNLNLTFTTIGISDIANNKSNLVKITDMLGQETPYRKKTPLFYIYDDGTVEKRIVIE